MNGTQNILIGIGVTLVGAISLATPGGSDILSALNLFMGGFVLALGLADRWSR